MPKTPLDRFTASVTAAFAAAMLCFFPLHIDRFSNLGITKYTTGFTLTVGFAAFIGCCAVVGARVPAGRFAGAKKDPALWGLGAFAAASTVATLLSLSPLTSLYGLGSYYGGLTLVLYAAVGYLCMRCYADVADLDYLLLGIGGTTIVVTVLYVLNIFNIDLIGTYANTAVVERAQFFSTLGQKDFNAAFMAVALPLIFYAFLAARGTRRTAVYGLPAVFGALALAVVDSEGLTLGMAAAVLVMVCHKDFDCRKLRRIAFLGVVFFAWAAWMQHMRSTVYTQGGTPLLAKFGKAELAVPGIVLCALLWLVLFLLEKRGLDIKTPLKLWMLGRAATVLLVVGAAGLLVLANLRQGIPALGSLNSYLVFNDDWGTYRGTAWRIAWGAWAQGGPLRWLFGFGPGTMHSAVTAWAGTALTPRMNTFYAAHNEYLEQLLTTGLCGLAAWLVFVGASLRRGFKNWAKPGVAPVLLALCSYLSHAVVSIRVSMLFPQVLLLFALLAVLTAPQPAPSPATKPARRSKKQQAAPAPTAKQKYLRYGKITLAAALATAAAGAAAPVLFGFLY